MYFRGCFYDVGCICRSTSGYGTEKPGYGEYQEKPFRQVWIVFLIAGIVLLVGTSMDVTPSIMILTPVLLPAVKAAGIDTGYFGVVFILMCVLGLLTPPVGTVLNVACGAGKINMERIVKAIWPFLLAEVIILLLMVCFPSLIIVPMNFFTGG